MEVSSTPPTPRFLESEVGDAPSELLDQPIRVGLAILQAVTETAGSGLLQALIETVRSGVAAT